MHRQTNLRPSTVAFMTRLHIVVIDRFVISRCDYIICTIYTFIRNSTHHWGPEPPKLPSTCNKLVRGSWGKRFCRRYASSRHDVERLNQVSRPKTCWSSIVCLLPGAIVRHTWITEQTHRSNDQTLKELSNDCVPGFLSSNIQRQRENNNMELFTEMSVDPSFYLLF